MPTLQDKQQERNELFNKIKADYETLFSSPVGQRVLKDIKLSSGVEKEIFNSDAMQMALAEGKRHIGLHIIFMATPRPEKKPEEAIRS